MNILKSRPATPAPVVLESWRDQDTLGGRIVRWGSAPLSTSAIVGGILLIVVLSLKGNYNDSLVVLSLSYAIAATGMSVQIGYSHQLAFSQSLFVGVGAYGVAILNGKYGVEPILALLIMLGVAAVAAALIGSLVTRAPGLALAVATLLFPLILNGYVTFSAYLGQTTGLGGVHVLYAGGNFTSSLVRSGVVSVALLAASMWTCGRLINSGVGLELHLVGEGQAMAEALGILVRRRKLEVFVFGCVLATLGGAVYAGTQSFVSPDIFSSSTELTLLVMLFIGGRKSLAGAVVGALAIEFLSGSSTWVSTHLLLIEGVLLTAVLLYEPDGLAQIGLRLAKLSQRMLRPNRTSAGALLATDGPTTEPDSVQSAVTDLVKSPVSITVREPIRSDLGESPDAAGPVLEVRDLTRSFGGLVAVNHVSLEIGGVGVYGICGPNGAGKSTLFGLIGGAIAPDSGIVNFQGRDITRASATTRANLGIARTFQATNLMADKTALDNVAVACLPSHHTFLATAMFRRDLAAARDQAYEVLRSVGATDLAKVNAARLTLEGQRMVELARALAPRPQLLLLDEPASGLSVEQRARLGAILAEIGTRTTVVLVEHDLQLLTRLASKLFMLIDGTLEFAGDPTEFQHSPIVRTALMGLLDDRDSAPN